MEYNDNTDKNKNVMLPRRLILTETIKNALQFLSFLVTLKTLVSFKDVNRDKKNNVDDVLNIRRKRVIYSEHVSQACQGRNVAKPLEAQ